jgi:hypothetical protein
MNTIQSNQAIRHILDTCKVNPEHLCIILTAGIEIERINQQANEIIRDENKSYDSQIHILQAERFLCLLRSYAALN